MFSAPPEMKLLAGSSKSLSFLDPKNVVDKVAPGNPLAPIKYQADTSAETTLAAANRKKAEAESSLAAQFSTQGGGPQTGVSKGALTKGYIEPQLKTKLG